MRHSIDWLKVAVMGRRNETLYLPYHILTRLSSDFYVLCEMRNITIIQVPVHDKRIFKFAKSNDT